MTAYQKIVDEIRQKQTITLEQLRYLLTEEGDKVKAPQQSEADCNTAVSEAKVQYLYQQARKTADEVYGKKVFKRGLIEFTNYCKNDCFYCGIRRSNAKAGRYRLEKETILDCCRSGYALGFRTFVLQGGEDAYFTDERICEIVAAIRREFPDCAITLSIGEKSKESYLRYFEAGANRYLLRHETANEAHYRLLHPDKLSLQNRKRCLWDLKEIGYQVGCGFMVGSPGQTIQILYEDLCFIKELGAHMVGIGPFIPQKDTPFGEQTAGSLEQTRKLLAIIRLLHPHVLLPATTALGTIHEKGRELGILSGANVVMPNLSPKDAREKYMLYDNKIHSGTEAAEGNADLQKRMREIGYELVTERGDFLEYS